MGTLRLIQMKFNQMQFFKERGKPVRAEKRTNKFNPHITPSLEIEPGPHWWEASALTTSPPLLSKIHNSNIVIATKSLLLEL